MADFDWLVVDLLVIFGLTLDFGAISCLTFGQDKLALMGERGE